MMRSFRSEWVKLRRRSLLLSTYLSLTALSALFTVLVFTRASNGHGRGERFISLQELAQPDGLSRGLTRAALLLGVVALGIAASQVAFEFSLGTLRQLLVRQPRRPVLLSGKGLAILTFLAGAVIGSGIGGSAAAFVMAHVRGISTSAWTSSAGVADIGHALGDIALAVTGYSILGILAGLILRSPAPAAVVGFVYLLPFEGIFSAVVKGADRWLPGQVLSAISEGGTSTVTFSHAMMTATAYAVVAAVAGVLLFTKRDVTA
jgi:ABC-type transport system involved in multi-copper enzyme maturation permease subunit